MAFERTNDLLESKGEDFKISPMFDDGIVFEYEDAHGKKQTLKTVSPKDSPRKVTLDISTFLGSIGAVHYYAKLDIYPHSQHVYASNGKPYSGFIGSGDYGMPFGAGWVRLEVLRRVDKRDLKYDKEQHEWLPNHYAYGRMKKTDWTHGWWSREEAQEGAIAWFKKHFEPGWILVPQYWNTKKQPILARS